MRNLTPVMSSTLVTSTPQSEHESVPSSSGGARLFAIRVINYLTNHVVAHIPSFTVRHMWYRRVLGLRLADGVGVHLGCYMWFYGPSGIRRSGSRIGANSRINRDCTLDLRGGLIIGENVSVSAEATLLTSAGMANSKRAGEAKPIVIEDNAWIGVRAIVMPGVTIGRGAVVGAGAVVMRDVPPLATVFGSPARPVGTREAEEADYVLGGPLPLFE
jgi:acetyltransferase-like isoleucine patch superfamily enzyme